MLGKHSLLIITLIFWKSFASFAQADKADKLYLKANTYYKARQATKAIATMQEAIAANPKLVNAYADLGLWQYTLRDYTGAIETFSKGSTQIKNGASRFALAQAKCLLGLYDWQSAQSLYATMGLATKPWQQVKRSIDFQKQHPHKISDSLQKLSNRINTEDPENFPLLSADGSQLLYATNVLGLNEEIYLARWDSCTNDWFSGKPIVYPINSPLLEAAASISADGHYLFLMRCDNASANGWDDGGCDLYMAYMADSTWSVPLSFGGTINSTGFEGTPSLSPDNKRLYFSADRPGGYGGKDIWVATFKEGKWQVPKNLGPTINTPGDETAPFLHPDNKTLFFVSDYLAGYGGFDIFRSRLDTADNFSTPQNLGYPFNSSANERSFTVSADGLKAFLSSDRFSSEGAYDIYSAALPENLQPDAVSFVHGYTYDSLSTERLNLCLVSVKNIRTGEEEYQYVTNRGDGSFMMSLPLYEKYHITTRSRGYLPREDTVFLTEQSFKEAFLLPLSLLPDYYEAPISVSTEATLYFEKNAVAVSNAMKKDLESLIEKYGDKQDIRFVINSYTDNSGTPMLNEQLSTQRAELIKDYLSLHGMSATQISVAGWGEANPVVPNDTEDNRNKNRRVEIVIEESE